jgi:hypothetical protein
VIGLGPVTILLAAAAGMAVLRLLATGRGGALAGTGIALLGVLGAGTTLVSSPMDSWSRAAGILVLVGGLPGVLATRGRSPARETDLRMVLLVLLAAAVLAVSAEDWIALTAAFGLLTLTGTLLAGAGPRGFEAERARPALAVEGAALGLFLFGAALASGMAGTTELDGLARLPEETPGATGCALLLILAAPALRLSAWPFPGGPGGTPGPVASGLLAATGATVGVGVAGEDPDPRGEARRRPGRGCFPARTPSRRRSSRSSASPRRRWPRSPPCVPGDRRWSRASRRFVEGSR